MIAAGRVPAIPAGTGNAALARMLSSPRMLSREDTPTAAEIAEADAWAAEGIRRGTNLTPGAPGAGLNNAPGGFDAKYDPGVGRADDHHALRRRVHRRHLAGRRRPPRACEKQLDRAQRAADRAAAPGAARAFRWPEDKSAEERLDVQDRRRDARSSPSGAASHEFFLRKKGWSWLGATVKVDLQVGDKEDDPRRAPDDQARSRSRRTSRSAPTSSPDSSTNARDQVMNVSSNIDAVRQLPQPLRDVRRQPGRRSSARQATKLQKVIDTFKGAETEPRASPTRARSRRRSCSPATPARPAIRRANQALSEQPRRAASPTS